MNKSKIIIAMMLMMSVLFATAFTTYKVNDEGISVSGEYNGHDFVDLGLPSGTLWATCNVGANAPEEYGDYFAWGETQPKSLYDWSTYKYCNGDNKSLLKYCNKPEFGFCNFTDNLIMLQDGDDVATVNWGVGWCMPKNAQWEELFQYTNITWTTVNGINGILITADNGNTLFLPAAGGRIDREVAEINERGYYWTTLLRIYSPDDAWFMEFSSTRPYELSWDAFRSAGLPIRPVRLTN